MIFSGVVPAAVKVDEFQAAVILCPRITPLYQATVTPDSCNPATAPPSKTLELTERIKFD